MKISKKTAEHYIWGDNCDGWHLVKRSDISIIHERMPSMTQEVMHYHEISKQFFFILKGKVLMIVEDEEVILEAGEGIEVLPLKLHQMKNTSEDEVEFIVYSTPSTIGDRIAVDKIN